MISDLWNFRKQLETIISFEAWNVMLRSPIKLLLFVCSAFTKHFSSALYSPFSLMNHHPHCLQIKFLLQNSVQHIIIKIFFNAGMINKNFNKCLCFQTNNFQQPNRIIIKVFLGVVMIIKKFNIYTYMRNGYNSKCWYSYVPMLNKNTFGTGSTQAQRLPFSITYPWSSSALNGLLLLIYLLNEHLSLDDKYKMYFTLNMYSSSCIVGSI